MAAYASLISLINDLDLIPNHPRHSFSFENNQIACLNQIAHFLIDFMGSYDALGCSREAAEVLESRIASAANEAHDVVESHVVDQIRAGSTLRGKPRSYFLLDLQGAIDNMNFVKRKVMQFREKGGMKAKQPTYSSTTSSEPQTFRKLNRMVGFDAVVVRLMEMLVGEASSQLVIPIVGMGGIGKTTLARNAYQHSLVEQHFDIRHWATISQEYSAENVLTQLLFGEGKSTSGRTVNGLGQELHKKLWGRRYLIILDDMWSMEAWDEIHMFLPDNGNGSRVVVTTRLSDLATSLRSSPFKMEFLDEDQSWKLFCEKAFDAEECPVELDEIGKKIVRKCQGLPLSIVIIGGHLRKSSRATECWEKVSNSMNPISVSEEGEKCMKIISLSYDKLPISLKPCFLYMGKFSEDEWIDTTKLVRLWIAEGLVRAKEGLSLEEVAEDYLNDLVDRNLVIVRGRRWNGKPETCGIHDIVRELCMKVSKKEKSLCVLDSLEGLSRECRIVIPDGKQDSDIINALKSAPLLRSITWMQYRCNKLPLESTQLLRVSEGECSLAATDFQPLNLRYLYWPSFGQYNKIFCLPGSISLFWNLQTLIIRRVGIQITAPAEIWEMVQLRHLVFYRLYLPNPLSSDQQERIVLRNLQTLLGAHNLRLTEEVCERMPNIKELSLFYDCSGFYSYNFGRFNKLVSLELYGLHSVRSFTFPNSLQELELWDSDLHWKDVGEMIRSLPHLGALRLSDVRGHEWNPEDEFPRLKSLTISYCDDLVYWNANSFHFPVLEALDITFLPGLSEMPSDIGNIPTLASIELNYCSVSAAVSAMRILVEQESFGNHELQLLVYFNGMEEVERFQKMVQEEDLRSDSLRLHCRDRKIKNF